mgnify:CR=1 FL=1
MQKKVLYIVIYILTLLGQTAVAADYYVGQTIKGKSTEGVEITFEITSLSPKTCRINSYGVSSSASGKVTVPYSVEGFTVVEAEDLAFSGCSNISSISLPSGLTKIGGYAFNSCGSLKEVSLPSGLTEIGNGAFQDCTSLKSFSCPSNLTRIGDWAFNRCESLESFSGGSNLKEIGEWAFSDCTSLKTFSCPSNLTKIEDYTFFGCESLESFSGGSNLKEIGEWAFSNCTSLKTITNISNLEYIGNYAFDYTPWNDMLPSGMIYLGKVAYKFKDPGTMAEGTQLEIKEGTTCITDYAFISCSKLISVSIPKSVTSIGNNPFEYCTNLVSIEVDASNKVYDSRNNCNAIIHTATNCLITGCSSTVIPTTVKSIGYGAFDGNDIKSITIPDNIDSLASYSFGYCRHLKSITVGKGLRVISSPAFIGCQQLEDIVVSASNPYFNSPNNCKGIVEKSTNTLLVGCLNTIIPSSVKRIGRYAFSTCYSGNFYTYTISDNVESIESDAFEYNSNLRSITIGRGVKEIGSYAFYGCNNLLTIRSKIETPFEINENTFINNSTGLRDSIYNNAILYVPVGSRVNYMTTPGWNKFKHIVESSGNELEDGEVFTEETTEGNLLYYKILSNKQSTCELIGASNSVSGSITIPRKANGYTVVSLADNCFYDYYTNRDITAVSIPDDVTRIGKYAFYYCKNLRSVSLPKNLISIGSDAFYQCESLSLPEIPNTVVNIDTWAFGYCKGSSISIPASVRSIGAGAFGACKELSSITVDASNSVYASPDGCNAIIEKATKRLITGCKTTVIPNSVECIGNSAFSRIEELTSIKIPNSVSIIDSLAFSNTGLTSIEIPSSVRSIAYCAFRYCDNLKTIISKIETPFGIPNDVFENRTEVESTYEAATLYVPVGTKALYQSTDGWKLFANIVELDDFSSTDNVDYETDGVAYELYPTDKTAKVVRLTKETDNVIIPTTLVYKGTNFNVTTIGESIFPDNINNIYSITFPSTIATVQDNAFNKFAALSMVWNSSNPLPASAFSGNDYKNRNFLLYVKQSGIAPSGFVNVIVNGTADDIALIDGEDFYCPQEFTARKISYTHNYQMQTGINESAGWESIALPFDVNNIEHETRGSLTPFALWQGESGNKPFWLYSLGSNGFTRATSIKANTPYIISMPNNSKYSANYNIAGRVTFSATDAKVYCTDYEHLRNRVVYSLTI